MSEQPPVVFVDDDPKAADLFQRFCQDCDFMATTFQRADDALEHFKKYGADVVVTDLNMPGRDGMSLMHEILAIDPDTAVIMITGYSTVDNAIQAMKSGATDFIKKPYDMDELIAQIQRCLKTSRLKRENRLLKRQLKNEREHYGMIGKSPRLDKIHSIIEKIADVRCNVIIEGESGTGKELVARAIHQHSQDSDQPFVVIDCGAMTESLLESELFGHEKGAFTGATHTKKGLLETASGGTVFLDEIGNISDAMQVKLLRVVQENEVVRVGGIKPSIVNLRFIAASNQNLEQMSKEGRFRHDLFHRLNVIKLTMPALRDRPEDIPLLVQHFINEFSAKYKRDVSSFDAASMRWLYEQPWPGNIRELRNLVERHIALADEPIMHISESDNLQHAEKLPSTETEDWPSLRTLEDRYIRRVLSHTDDNRERAAAILGIDKSTLWRKLKQK
ncbi:MAG: sigma-54-dependent Fis family transcriptional regulator [Gammaproteobacteria bacterium]|nr:MAG: sigma-54-dependent Fis family transcriptional regulator [Gammaproteobacteria bacterium]